MCHFDVKMAQNVPLPVWVRVSMIGAVVGTAEQSFRCNNRRERLIFMLVFMGSLYCRYPEVSVK